MLNSKKLVVPFVLIALALCGVAARLFYLQVWSHEDLDKRARKLNSKEVTESPCRGTIFDRNGRVLAMSIKYRELFADPTQIKDIDEAERVLKLNGIDLPRAKVEKSNSAYVPVCSNLGYEAANNIKASVQASGITGFGFTTVYRRQYPEGKLACHLLGIVGKDGNGLEGAEYVANSYLCGDKVKELALRDGRGRTIAKNFVNPADLHGADVYLTIDRNIQFIAEQEIDKAWRESKAKKAIAIVQDPNTGEILAMAVRPNYDPSDFSGSWQNLRNPAVSDVFEPGSTFKIFTAAAALEENLASRSEVIWCENGKYSIYDHVIKDHEKMGLLTFDQIMEYSSNIGMAKIGQRVGKKKLYSYIKQFGFFSLTGLDMPGEAKGLLKNPSSWSGLSLPIISFGQEIGVTAIQLINGYTSIANGGDLLEPRILGEIRNSSGEVLYKPERRIIRKSVSARTSTELKDMLFNVVEKGTGQLASVQGYSVGGKTGTAQKRDKITGKYSSSCYVASFCGIIPLNSPRATIYVVLDEPQGDYYAASRAAPIFGRIASRVVQYLKIHPDKTAVSVASGKIR
jgi:cell division protein FtsI (penicillin-binding protein 3)